MHITEFGLFHKIEDAQALIDAIDKRKLTKNPETWAQVKSHPIESLFLVPLHRPSLLDCNDLIDKINVISRLEARSRGFDFGFFQGRFAREQEKMEDIHFLFDGIVSFYGNPNFPTLRSMILSFLSACYSLRKSFETKVKIMPELLDWWDTKKIELDNKSELLKQFEVFMNNEKHGGPMSRQFSKIELRPACRMTSFSITHFPSIADPSSIILSAEGAFAIAFKGTHMERRVPVGMHDAQYEVIIENPPKYHLGELIEGQSVLTILSHVREYYAKLVFEALKFNH